MMMKDHQRGNVKPERAPSDGPFCWQTKAAFRLIRDCFDDTNNVSAARSVYLALCEIASDAASAVFTATVAHIAKYAGLSTRTVSPLIASLAELGLVCVRQNRVPGSKLKAPSTYEVLPIRNDCASIGNNCASIRNDQKQTSLPRYEESLEESSEENNETHPSRTHRATHLTPTGVWRACYQRDELEIINLYNTICTQHGWLKVNRHTDALQTALREYIEDEKPTTEAVEQRLWEAINHRENGDKVYNAPKGNKLIRILKYYL